MGAVATIFSTFTVIFALLEHIFITQTRETELCLSHNIGSLRGSLFLKNTHSHSRWLPLHTMQQEVDVDEEICYGLPLILCCVFATNAFEAYFDLVTEWLVSSVLALVAVLFVKLSTSAFPFHQSLKSRRVGFTQCFLTVKSDHNSFILGGSFCTAELRSAALYESESYESDLNTPTKL